MKGVLLYDKNGLPLLVGQQTKAASLSAVLASDQPPVPVTSGKTLLSAPINVSASGDTTIVAAQAGKKITVYHYIFIAAAAVSVTWKDGAAALSGAMPAGANGGAAPGTTPPAFLFQGSTNTALVLNLGGAVQVSGHVSYWLE
jgi:hypothetical protein